MSSDQSVQTNHSLLRRLKDWSDQTSWEEFVKTYSKQIYDISIRAGLNDSEAKDVLQETLLLVANKVGEFKTGRAHGSFRVWLLQAARWRIADQFRKRVKWRQAGTLPEQDSGTAVLNSVPDPMSLDLDAALEQSWRQNVAQVAMDKIKNEVDPQQYQIFDLHVLREYRAREVAERFGISVSQVYLASYRISRLLKREIKRMSSQFG